MLNKCLKVTNYRLVPKSLLLSSSLSMIQWPSGSDQVLRCLSHSTNGSGATISGCLSTWRGPTLRTRREESTLKRLISTSRCHVPLCFYSCAIYLKGTTRLLVSSDSMLETLVLFVKRDELLKLMGWCLQGGLLLHSQPLLESSPGFTWESRSTPFWRPTSHLRVKILPR